jgi:hypothetical protein
MIRRWPLWVLLLASLRLAHINLLWADEDYHLAAAIQMTHGRMPYRDFWYDKPPLAALFYSLIGGYGGWPLRVLDIVYVLACCWMAYKLANAWWGEREGRAAALLLSFFMAFYLTSATIPLAVDGLLLLPHLAAIYFAFQRRPLLSGLCCALGLLVNVKGVFVAVTCALWLAGDWALFAAGLAAPLALGTAIGAAFGLLPGFYQQVWQWGLIYAGTKNSAALGLRRSADWLGFHAALLAGVIAARRDIQYRAAAWLVLSWLPLLMGNHFAPRYFFQVLPVMVIFGSRGLVISSDSLWKLLLAVLLLIPAVRFGPRYAELIRDNIQHRHTTWPDAALDIDAQQVANLINARKHAGDSLLVWGYRPDIYVYTRLLPAGKFWDSQPLDGVPADRHLESSRANAAIPAAANRAELLKTEPTFVVDGLGLLNPALALGQFPDLKPWLDNYRLVATTKLTRIYQHLELGHSTQMALHRPCRLTDSRTW